MSHTLNWLLAALLALTLGAAHLLDGPDELQTQLHIAQDKAAAIEAAQRTSAFDRHARAVCGNAPWQERDDGSIVCQPRRGIRGGAVVLAAGERQ